MREQEKVTGKNRQKGRVTNTPPHIHIQSKSK